LTCGVSIAPNEGRLRQEYEETEGKRGDRAGKVGTGNAEGDTEQQRQNT
jgi:hypothetical protein